MKTLTTEWLVEHDACDTQVDRFESLFGRRCPVTEKNVARWLGGNGNKRWSAERDGLGWLIETMLDASDVQLELAQYIGEACACSMCIVGALFELPMERVIKAVVQIADRVLDD